jgi:hypothetical protein
MDNPNSPLDTLRQLKEMLDAGALTPTEFEALKQRLVLNPSAIAPSVPAADVAPVVPTAISMPPLPPPVASLPPPVAAQPSPTFEDVAAGPAYTGSESSAPNLPAAFPEPLTPAPQSEPAPSWQTSNEFPAVVEEPARNPLALILSIGGVLVFLAVVAYLSFNRPPSERISSTSMTAADSVAAVIETGPQAAPLPQSTAVPETVRVAPTNPAPVIQPRPAPVARDSAANVPATPASDSAAGQ